MTRRVRSDMRNEKMQQQTESSTTSNRRVWIPWPANEEPSSCWVSPVPWDGAEILPGEPAGWLNLLPCARVQSSTGSHSCRWGCPVGQLLSTASSPVTVQSQYENMNQRPPTSRKEKRITNHHTAGMVWIKLILTTWKLLFTAKYNKSSRSKTFYI